MEKSEGDLMRSIMLAVGKARNVRVFRNNTGLGWVGKTVRKFRERGNDYIVIENPRPLHSGLCVGSSDIIGLLSVTITPEMVGRKVAIFTALEVKKKGGRTSPEQTAFLEMVADFGGVAGKPLSEADAVNMLQYGGK